ncbi:MAG: hypothetical protein A3J69_00120 [Candidatus Levybacteria bacterium RIFCSPHIGHO2_02_FULL_42_12]|nr:MAG: hypothetical protein A3J69_00120 [Candidatus Levybacteria bacterium RIFCSPHIGHO2_02_FULL_42_12]
MVNTQSPYDDILVHAKTQKEADLLLSEIDELLSSLYVIKKNALQTVLEKSVRVDVARGIESLLPRSKKPEDIKTVLHSLRNDVQKIPTLKVTLAFEPSEKMIETLYDWAKETLGEIVLLDITYDPLIVGGVVMSWKGAYIDASLKTKLDNNLQHLASSS